jgi:hypothetical protein
VHDGVTLGDDKPVSNRSDEASTDVTDIQLIGFGEILRHTNWVEIKGFFLGLAVWNEEEVKTILVLDRADL